MEFFEARYDLASPHRPRDGYDFSASTQFLEPLPLPPKLEADDGSTADFLTTDRANHDGLIKNE